MLLLIGQDAGLIHDIPAAGEIVERIVAEAKTLEKRLPELVGASYSGRRDRHAGTP